MDDTPIARALLASVDDVIAAQPTPREDKILRALDETVRALALLDEALASERARRAAESAALAALPLADAALRGLSWEKSPEQERLEGERRRAKALLQRLLLRLCEGRMYSRADVLRAASEDGDVPTRPGGPRDATAQAIRQADLWDAAASIENDYARRAFWLTFKHHLPEGQVALRIGTDGASVRRLIRLALDHIDQRLNAPVVDAVRAKYFQFCLDNGLAFPEYALLRGQ